MGSSKAPVGKDLHPCSHGCWQHSALCGLLDWGPPFLSGCQLEAVLSSLPRGSFQQSLVSSKPTRKGMSWQDGCYNGRQCHHTYLVTIAIFSWLEASHRSHLHSKEEYYKGKKTSIGALETTLRSVCNQFLPFFLF